MAVIVFTELKGQFREERFFQIKIIRLKFLSFIMSGIVEKVSKAEFAVPHRHTIILYQMLGRDRRLCRRYALCRLKDG